MQTLNSNAISATSPHPEAGIQFLSWFYGKEENHDLVIYGIEGVHWQKAENGRITREVNANGAYVYNIPLWQMGHKDFRKFETYEPDEEIVIQTVRYKDVQYSSSLGFKFDPEPVQMEYQAVVAEIPSLIMPISHGVQSYDTYYEAAIAKLDSIGYQKVVDEVERQYNEWAAGR
jgi:putative aldouronate transport system substrate-binding protein